ncbi:AT-rich interactive domain-containing protein 4B isoform X4 [Nilaparvata lugens]|uniref:AT-rich interactive domain-containing protein 4B isoform X4 n=1 Tax=Nilaparvata lugens TaxID=108931 RepID=UPI00193EB057|nr:AT-rich interactive domain-containing protein 4B isoform X4 [Nilaparvata lugens]
MQRWGSKREMMGDDPPYLTVGTEVSAKYKGAFCEAEVRKVVRSVKCKVAFKFGLGNATVTDDQIRGSLRAGSNVEVKHPEKKEFVEATITKIQDCSQYTVVFDDGDITTLRRTALCLKSGRHFAESETLDQLPLTHPEHFGNPVIGGRRGRRNREESSDDDDDCLSTRKGGGGAGGRGSGGRGGGSRMEVEKEADIGKVVCVEMSDKKKQKDNWFPGLVVAPTAQDTVRIHVKEEYLVRSFKDGRYYTVPKKEATSFTREIGSKVDNNTLRTAVDKALLFLDKDELPPHWDRELLFGLEESTGSESDADLDSDSSDNEPREEKDHFVAQLYKFMDDRGTPINKGPTISAKDVDLYKLFMVVQKLGGYNRVTNHNQWKTISHKLGFGQNASTVNLVKHAYKKFLHSFEDFYRKLGCTMLSHPRNNRARHRSSRSLIRDRDRATPKIKDKDGKDSDDPKEASTSQDVIKKEEVVKEEEKPKEVTVVETPKRESRSKEMMRSAKAMTKEDNKVEKKEMEKVQQQQQQQQHEAVATTVKKSVEETRRGGEEGARSKERVKLTASSSNEEQHKANKNIQLTRSKSKEDIPIRVRKEPTSTDTKKTSSSPQNLSSPNNSKEQSEADKRRGRKRKEDEKGPCEEVLDQLPSYKSVSVGDKLKVYYGPTHESKVTYEAKVLSSKEENSETLYLVHYTGWNTRYDEWIKRSRIADNLSWSPGRVKRNRQPQQQCLRRSAGGAAPTKRGRSSDTGRSTAPSPSPRARLPSSTRTHTRSKQSSRRISAHTDLSDTDSGDESDSESDSESNSPLQKRADKMVGSSDEKDEMEIRTKRRAALAFAHTLSFESKEDKRKPTAPSTSEDERDLEKCKDDVDRKPHERRSASRVSIEKEQNDEQTAERRGRKLRSDRASRPLSDSDEEKDEEKDKREGKRVSLERRKNEESKAKLEVKKESNELDDGQSSRISRTNENSCKDDSDESLAKLRRKTEVHKMECDDGKSQTVDDNTNRSDRLRNRSDNKKRFEAKTTDDTSKFDSKMQSIVDKVLKSTSVEPEIKPEVKEIKEEPASDVSESGENKKKTRYERVKKERNAEDESSQDTERNRRSRRVVMNKKDDAKASSSKDDSDDEVLQQPKGRDFDLMQIRSELKGIDKAVKMPLEVKSSETEVKEIASASDVVKKEPVDVKVKEEQESPTKEAMDLSADDIYEFKEPEPFEFEVRPKCSEEKGGKMQRRTFGRMCDELPKTPSPLKRKLVRSKPSRSPPEVKKRFRRSITKKDECPSSDAKGAAEPETSNQTTEKKSVEKPAVPVKSLIEEQKDIKNVAPKEVIEKEKEIPSRVVGLESSAKPQTNELSVPNDAVKPVLDKVGRGTLDEELNEVKSIDEPVKVAQDATEKKVEEKVAEIVEKGANSIDVDDDDDDDGENRLVIFELDEQEKEKRENAASMSDSKEASKVTVVEMKKEEVKKVEPPTKEVVVEANKDLVTIEKKDDVPKKVEPPKVSVVEEEEEKKRDVKKVVEEKREEVDKSEEEEDDEAINAAIRRVIQQTDEESNDFDSLPPPVRTVAPPPPPPPPQAPQTPSPITSYKKDNKRRKVTISKEFIEESDSDSDVEVKPIPKPTTSISTSLAHSMGTVTTSAPAIQSPVVLQKPVTVTIPSVLKTTTLPVQTSASLKSNFTLSALQGSKITTAACGLIKPTLPGTKILLNVSTSVHRPPMATVATTGHLPILTAIHKPPPLTFTSPLTLTRPCLPLLTQRPPQSTDPSTSKQTLTLPILSAKPIITTSTNLPQTVSNFTLLSSDMKALPHLIPKPNFVTQSTSTSIKSTPILIATTVPTAALTATDTKKLAEKKDSVEVKVEDKCIRIVTVDEASIKTNKAASEISNVAEKKEEVIVATVKDAVKEDKIDVVGNLIQQKKSSTSELVPLPTVVEHKIVPEVIEPVKEVKAADKVVEIQKIVEDKPGKVETKSEEVMKMVLEEMPKTNKVEEEDDEDDIKLEIAVEEEVKSEDEEEERRIMKEFDLAEEETMEADEDDGEVEDEDMDADEEEEEDEVEEREEEEEECVQSLLCEETIPGSPAPPAGKGKGDNDDDDDDDDDDDGESDKRPLAKTNELPFASAPGTSQHSGTSTNHSKPVVQQAPLTRPLLPPPPSAQPPMAVVAPPTAPPDTPPTTPDSSLSPISNSPRGERSGSSPGLDNDSTKSQRDSSEIDLDYTETNKIGHFSEEDSVCAASVAGTTLLKKPLGMATSHQPQLHHDVESSPSKKRRRSRKRSEEVCKRAKLARRSPRNPAGSDSDDTSENSLAGSSLDVAASSRSPKPSKHNFYVQLDPELDGAQRIEVLQKKLQELRTTYMSLKSELACIDRRRKKLRRREREEKCSRQQEVQCS